MDSNSVFGEVLEQAKTTVTRNTKAGVQDFAQTAKGQIIGDSGTNEQATQQQPAMSDDQAQQFLKELYGKNDKTPRSDQGTPVSQNQQKQNPLHQAIGITPQVEQNTPEELLEIEKVRKELHGDYYHALVNPVKQKEEPVVEKLEREEQEEKMKIFEERKKKPDPLPPSVKQGTGEKLPGVSG